MASNWAEVLGYKVDMMNELGSGGFGIVYKGLEMVGDGCDYQNPVAMKKVSKRQRRNASTEAVRFHYMKEKIDHENIVKVFDVKSSGDCMWIIMEYCDLGDLNDFFMANFQSRTNAYFPRTLEFMQDISRGIAFLHEKDIVHRDIKPLNILIKTRTTDSTGSGGHSCVAKLGDFGLSKILDPEDMTSAMSTDVGTTAFKAPEFWDREPGEKVRYHRNVDVFSAGLSFAAMLQAKPGRNLVPRVEHQLQPSESNMAVGHIAFSRQADVTLCEEGTVDEQIIRGLKRLIRRMTKTFPKDRISAAQVLEILSKPEELESDYNDSQGNAAACSRVPGDSVKERHTEGRVLQVVQPMTRQQSQNNDMSQEQHKDNSCWDMTNQRATHVGNPQPTQEKDHRMTNSEEQIEHQLFQEMIGQDQSEKSEFWKLLAAEQLEKEKYWKMVQAEQREKDEIEKDLLGMIQEQKPLL